MLQKQQGCGKFYRLYCKSYKGQFRIDLAKASYFCVLSDGSTNSSVTEEELVHVLFLQCGKPTLMPTQKVFIVALRRKLLSELECQTFQKKVIALNVDGTAVNTGVHHGVGAKNCLHGCRSYTVLTTDLTSQQKMHLKLTHLLKLTKC